MPGDDAAGYEKGIPSARAALYSGIGALIVSWATSWWVGIPLLVASLVYGREAWTIRREVA